MARSYPIIPGINDTQGGQPSRIAARFDTREDGTDRTVGDAIIEEIRRGEWMNTACALVGITAETAQEWLRRAALVIYRTQADAAYQPTQHETNCTSFSERYRQAAAQWTRETLAVHDEIAAGGRRLTTTRVKRTAPTPERPAGDIIESITETREIAPDLRALEWRLAVRNPGRFSPKLQVIEAEDAPLDDEDIAAGLVQTVEGYLAAKAEGAPEGAEPG